MKVGFVITIIVFAPCFVNAVVDNDEGEIICPSCEQLELQSAGINESDSCHDYYDYVCRETSPFAELGKPKSNVFAGLTSGKISLPGVHSPVILAPRNVTKLEGDAAELTCPHSQPFNVTYKWKRNGILVNKNERLKYRSVLTADGSLHINDLHFDDSGDFTCEVFRQFHLIQVSNIYLSIETAAMVKHAPKVQYMISGKTSVLKCYVTSNPSFLFVTWTKNRRLFHFNTTTISMLPNGSMLFENPSKDDEGIYKCTPYNIHGTQGSSKPMRVIVKENLNEFDVHDARVEEANNETIHKNAKNLFAKRKKLKSRLMKLGKSKAKSVFVVQGVNETHADGEMINRTIITLFSKQRNEQFDLAHKESIRKAVIHVFQSYDLKTEIQKFYYEELEKYRYIKHEAKNLIGILPSPNFGKPGDRIFVLGAHYDTVYENPGIDDNGSGSAYVLEAARLLSSRRNNLNATIYFVLFDQEETGLEGSIAFVDEYLIPKVIMKMSAVYSGAFLADMLLLYDPNENVQTLPSDIQEMCPEAWNWISKNSFRGDFMSVWGRNTELFLWRIFKESWDEIPNNRFKLLLLNSPLPDNQKDFTLVQKYSTFGRSDHASFWSSSREHPDIITLPAALLSDMGPWRGYERMCYHQPCDNEIQLTETNIQFLAQTVDTVVASVVKLVGVSETKSNMVLN